MACHLGAGRLEVVDSRERVADHSRLAEGEPCSRVEVPCGPVEPRCDGREVRDVQGVDGGGLRDETFFSLYNGLYNYISSCLIST